MLQGAGVDGVEMAVGAAIGHQRFPGGQVAVQGEAADELGLKGVGVLGGGRGFAVGDEVHGGSLVMFRKPFGALQDVLGAHGEKRRPRR